MSARDDIHRLFASGATSYRLDSYLEAHRAEVIDDLAAKLDGRLKLTEHKTVSKDAIRRFLQMEASVARATSQAPDQQPRPEFRSDTARRAQLLFEMAKGGKWRTRSVVLWYGRAGYVGLGRRTARLDLTVLRDTGRIHQHDRDGFRYFTTSLLEDDRA
ncbi:hypothetical protein [Streptomyces sp. NPDC004250]|uniref:hypothetical protein n=1 Tax=Streptomyces sp. NPDC004250 TaxID=3364692 RepID=UPI0036A6E8CD